MTTTIADEKFNKAPDGILLAVAGSVEEMVRGLLEGSQHQHALLHLETRYGCLKRALDYSVCQFSAVEDTIVQSCGAGGEI
jgi:hypothetical protein